VGSRRQRRPEHRPREKYQGCAGRQLGSRHPERADHALAAAPRATATPVVSN
jgi:hypothetical protein